MNIIITGASRGLGFAMAARFAAAGHSLLLTSRDEKKLENAAERLHKEYPSIQIHTRAADLSNKEEAKSLGNWCLETAHPDVLINNAGYFVPGSLHNEPEGNLENMLSVNLGSAYHLTRSIVPAMISAKRGHIFNICSIASLKAYENGGSYSVSKFALLGFSKNLREELKMHGIKVTAVMPGAAYTDSWIGSGVEPARIMEAGDIAEMVFAATQLSPQAVVEDIVLRPQLGDL
jgi:short-subunit dehydrogenase